MPTRPTHLPGNLTRMVKEAMEEFNVPGLGLAVVHRGDVLHSRGYGVRTLKTNERVYGHTLFGIGSNTKLMTALALGLLIQDGKITSWDEPVIRRLPWFHMFDPWVTKELTIRDLLVHWSGLPPYAGDILWWPKSNRTRQEIVKQVQFIRPSYSFRNGFSYDNLMYIVAAELIEAVSGMSWEKFVTCRILTPAGMLESIAGHTAARSKENAGKYTSPHALRDDVLQVVGFTIGDANNPAGGVWSSANDIATWLLLWLTRGELPGIPRLFPETLAQQLMTPVAAVPFSPIPELPMITPTYLWATPGLFMRDYRGAVMYYHTGLVPGHMSRFILIPEIELGIGVVTNTESIGGISALPFALADHFLGLRDIDWVGGFKAYEDRLRQETAEARVKIATPDPTAKASLALAAYAGNYFDSVVGNIRISMHGEQLVIEFDRSDLLKGTMRYLYGDTFAIDWLAEETVPVTLITFSFNHDRTIKGATMARGSTHDDPSFNFEQLELIRTSD